MASLVLTIIGPDRPGLVEALAETVAEHGGNWLESRMAHLSGQFAGILEVSVAAERRNELAAALGTLSAEGIQVAVATSDADRDSSPRRLGLELVGSDRPGIIREISAALAAHEINVEHLETACSSAPMSGEALFRASAQLALPAASDLDAVRETLERIADDLMVDLALGDPADTD